MKSAKLFPFILSAVMLISTAAMAQEQTGRQKRLQKREQVNTNRQERVDERNPNGVGRVDNRLDRRDRRIDRKQKRTDKRVNRRSGN